MPTATLEELSNQHKNKKNHDGAETKETELNVLQRLRNKGAKDSESMVTLGMKPFIRYQLQKIEKAEGEGSCQARCSNSQQRSTCERQVVGIETIWELHTLFLL